MTESPTKASMSESAVHARLRIRHMISLTTLGECRNMRRAAERLNLTQSAVSKLLRETEEILGVVLFNRGKRGVDPTPAGEVMIRRARLLIADLASARDELAALERGASGVVRVGVLMVAEPILLPSVLLRLRQESPGISVVLRDGDREVLMARLRNGELDCVIGRLGSESGTDGLLGESLYVQPLSIVTNCDHPLAALTTVTWTMLAQEEWILPPPDVPLRQILDARFIDSGLQPPQGRIVSTSLFINKSLVEDTQMVSAMTYDLARHFQESSRMRILNVQPPLILPAVGMLARSMPPFPAFAKFQEVVRSEARKLAART